jgi:hypothetical protein
MSAREPVCQEQLSLPEHTSLLFSLSLSPSMLSTTLCSVLALVALDCEAGATIPRAHVDQDVWRFLCRNLRSQDLTNTALAQHGAPGFGCQIG